MTLSLLRLLFFLLLTGPVLFTLQAQDRLELIHSDVSRGSIINSKEDIKILQGNVHVRQDTLEIFCDLAVYYPHRQKAVLTGNVRLIRGSEVLTAQKVTYFEQEKKAIAEDSVHVQRPGQELFSEYLEYYYETDQALAKRNVRIIDQESRVVVTGREGEYLPDQQRSVIRGKAHFQQVSRDEQDTLHIYARKLEYRYAPTRLAIARDSVRIYRGALTAQCDSAAYFLDDERAFLRINPSAQQENNELTGGEMELIFEQSQLQEIVVRENALAISVEDSSAGKVNRLTGKLIRAYIQDNQIRELWAVDNARSRYYLKDESGDQGFNTASADTILISFREGEVNQITVIGGSQGIYYPADYQGKKETEF